MKLIPFKAVRARIANDHGSFYRDQGNGIAPQAVKKDKHTHYYNEEAIDRYVEFFWQRRADRRTKSEEQRKLRGTLTSLRIPRELHERYRKIPIGQRYKFIVRGLTAELDKAGIK